MKIEAGLGELLRYLQELTDGSADVFYKGLNFNYRPRYTPIMRALQQGPASVSELRDSLCITQGAISQTVKLMLVDDLIEKHQGQDARQSIISLSSHGEDVLQQLIPHWSAIFKAINQLEKDIGVPLMSSLNRTVDALKENSYISRINHAKRIDTDTNETKISNKHFESNGQQYAIFRPSYPVELPQSLACLVDEHQLALDVGCGNGQLTALLASHFTHVIGTDTSVSQLQHAQPVNNVRYLEQTAEDIKLADNSVDLIVAAQAAHWFDLDKFYAQARRVAKENAVIALISYGVPYIADPINAIFQQGYWQELHEFWPDGRQHVETAYVDLYFPFTKIKIANHNCHKSINVEEFIGYIKTWSSYKNSRHNNGQNKFNAFFNKLRNAWKTDDYKEVIWPVSVRAAKINQ